MTVYTNEELSRYVDQISEALNGKLDQGCMNSNINTPKGLNANGTRTVVESYVSGTSWYRVWSDKWCEQGGRISDAGGTVTFLKTFSSADYSVGLTPLFATSGSGGPNFNWLNGDRLYDLTSSGFTYGSYNGASGLRSWFACGFIL